MNFYNPYVYSIPTSFSAPKAGLFSRLLGGRSLSFGSILSGTQKTLNIVNQTIPLVKQVQPMVKNAKTMFRVMNEFKKNDNTQNVVNNDNTNNQTINNINNQSNDKNEVIDSNNQGPTFFM